MPTTPTRRYRCTYTPLDRNGFPVLSEAGILPFVQVQAATAEAAQIAAWHLTQCPVSQVDRLDDEETHAPAHWTFGALTHLQAERRAAQERALRAQS